MYIYIMLDAERVKVFLGYSDVIHDRAYTPQRFFLDASLFFNASSSKHPRLVLLISSSTLRTTPKNIRVVYRKREGTLFLNRIQSEIIIFFCITSR